LSRILANSKSIARVDLAIDVMTLDACLEKDRRVKCKCVRYFHPLEPGKSGTSALFWVLKKKYTPKYGTLKGAKESSCTI